MGWDRREHGISNRPCGTATGGCMRNGRRWRSMPPAAGMDLGRRARRFSRIRRCTGIGRRGYSGRLRSSRRQAGGTGSGCTGRRSSSRPCRNPVAGRTRSGRQGSSRRRVAGTGWGCTPCSTRANGTAADSAPVSPQYRFHRSDNRRRRIGNTDSGRRTHRLSSRRNRTGTVRCRCNVRPRSSTRRTAAGTDWDRRIPLRSRCSGKRTRSARS